MLQWLLYFALGRALPYVATAAVATAILLLLFARLQRMLLPCLEFVLVGGVTACLLTWMLY